MYRSLLLILNYKTIIISILSLIATYYCDHFKFIGDLPITLVGTAIIFPIVFSINSAYKRREDALMNYASLKSNLFGIFMASKNWLSNDRYNFAEQVMQVEMELMQEIKDFFAQNPNKPIDDSKIYKIFNQISLIIQSFRKENLSPTELSRTDQYLTRSIADFEKMKKILLYRTPNSLRTYSKFFTYSFPVLYAPYFAFHLNDGHETFIGYFSAVMYSFVFVSLINIQEQLENPFDQFGEDDIRFDVDEFKNMLRNCGDIESMQLI